MAGVPIHDDVMGILIGSGGYREKMPELNPTVKLDTRPSVLDMLTPTPYTITEADRTFATNNVDKINANTKDTGIAATIDMRGVLNLTNLGEDGKPIPNSGLYAIKPNAASGTAANSGTLNTGVANSVSSVLELMRKSKDPDQIKSFYGQFSDALNLEKATLVQQAQAHASTTLGIPALEAALAAEISADKNALDYFPGRGDSPATRRVRNDLEQARQYADSEAKRYLMGNKTAALLDSAEQQAKLIMSGTERTLERRSIIQAEKDAEIEAQGNSLPEHEINNAKIISPTLATPGDVIKFKLSNKGNPSMLEAIQATPDQIPFLVVGKANQYAKQVLIQNEKAAGVPEMVTQERMSKLARLMSNKTEMAKGMAALGGNSSSREQEADKLFAVDTEFKNQDKTQVIRARYDKALAILRADMLNRVVNDANSWASVYNVTDPLLAEPLAETKKIKENPNLYDVLSTYLSKAKSVTERSAMAGNFAAALTAGTSSYKNSLFGMPDPIILQDQITRAAVAFNGDWKSIKGILDEMGNKAANSPVSNSFHPFLKL